MQGSCSRSLVNRLHISDYMSPSHFVMRDSLFSLMSSLFVGSLSLSQAMPLVSSSRWLVKQGDLVQISSKENMFGQRKLCHVLLFLFNDLLLVATRKG